MYDDLEVTNLMTRLGEMIKGRYGRNLEIVRLIDVRDEGNKTLVTQIGSDIHIPLIHKDILLGKAILKHSQDLIDRSITLDEQAYELVKMTLEPVLYNEYLKLKIDNYERQQSIDIRPGYLSVINPDDTDEYIQSGANQLAQSILILNGGNEISSRKVAFEIHEQSGLWSFVQFKDIKNSITSIKDLLDLRGTTILFEEEDWLEWTDLQAHLPSLQENPDMLIIIRSLEGKIQSEEIFSIPLDRLPQHTLLRIESLQMWLKRSYM